MNPNFDLQTPSKKRKAVLFDTNFCIFCLKPFSAESPVCHSLLKLDKLLAACKERQDDTGKQILQNSVDIFAGEIHILYHKNCRSSHCSPYHIQRYVKTSKSSSVEV